VPRLIRVVALLAVLTVVPAARALASTTQDAMIEDDTAMLTDPSGTLQRLRLLGVDRVRLAVRWQTIAPRVSSRRRPRGFNAANPASYPARNWAVYDAIVRDAHQDGIGLDFDLMGGAPLWAIGPGRPRSSQNLNWEPSAREYGLFVRAIARRYSGTYKPRGAHAPLPRVNFWSIWNEPDYGPSLAPQGAPGHLTIEFAPRMYRSLVDAAWSALQATGHGRDTILFGEVAPRGENFWGVFSGMKPLRFLRVLYCLDSHYRQLRGSAAAARGCPTTAAGSRRFRRQHPGLFKASGFSDHPYMRWYPPNREAQPDPDYSTLGEMGNLERALDRVQRAYGSRARLPVYDTEFGYITSPPKHHIGKGGAVYISTTTAAYYLNWAEYLHWRDPRLLSYMQYLLYDPLPALPSNDYGGFASGLITFKGAQKATFPAWRLPLYLPVTSTRQGRSLEVWGCVRPSRYAIADTGQSQTAEIQFQPASGGPFSTIQTVTIDGSHDCYFDLRVTFPGSGTVRLAYTYPPGDALLSPSETVFSRPVQVTVR
jgi:hypothetical protein